MYSNTGGQCSKATPAGASVKFAMGGKVQKKKSLGEIFMTYEHVYVASISLSDPAQTLQALIEADQHNGPSIVIAYAPCVQQGVRPDGLNDMFEECKFAVDSGYWPLYRYKPSLVNEGQNPFILDSRKLREDVTDFLKRESRFLSLRKKSPGKILKASLCASHNAHMIVLLHFTHLFLYFSNQQYRGRRGTLGEDEHGCSSSHGAFAAARGWLQGVRP